MFRTHLLVCDRKKYWKFKFFLFLTSINLNGFHYIGFTYTVYIYTLLEVDYLVSDSYSLSYSRSPLGTTNTTLFVMNVDLPS